MREQILRFLNAVATGWEARAVQIQTLTNERLRKEFDAGYRAGYIVGKSKREERRAARGGEQA